VIDGYESTPSDALALTGGVIGGSVDFKIDDEKQTIKPGKISIISGIEDIFAFDLKIYPNPFNGSVRITCADVETWRAASLRVTNAAGILVHTQMLSSPDETIKLEHLPAGVYFFSVEKDRHTKTVKVIKN